MNVVNMPIGRIKKIFCPFCGKLAMDLEDEDPEAVRRTCPHLLFNDHTGGDLFALLRDDIADEDGEMINPELFSEPWEGDDLPTMFEQVRLADIPRSVCFEIDEDFHSILIGFCQDEKIAR